MANNDPSKLDELRDGTPELLRRRATQLRLEADEIERQANAREMECLAQVGRAVMEHAAADE